MRRDAEKDLVKLSIAIARRVLHRELTLDPESIDGLIKVALDKLRIAGTVPRARRIRTRRPSIRALLDRYSSSKVELIPDTYPEQRRRPV